MAEDDAAPEPTDILSKAASIENIVTWLIASSLCKGPQEFGWFMQHAADRIPVDEKIKLLGKIAEAASGRRPVVYDGFLDDLRAINRARVRVAHSVYVPFAAGDNPPGHVMFKKGLPDSLSDEELRAQVSAALSQVPRLMAAFESLGRAAGLMEKPRYDGGAPLPQRYTRRTRWRATVLNDDVVE